MPDMGRREAVALLGGAAAWPLAARAQQPQRMRLIGVLMNSRADDLEGKVRYEAFLQGLQKLGWTDSRNVRIEDRWTAGDADSARRYATELVALVPQVILASGASVLAPLSQASHTLPIVFVNVIDPVGAGFVESLARPGGNVTGFTSFEYDLSGKWPELLKQIAPRVTRAGVLRESTNPVAEGQLGAIQAAASSLGIEVTPLSMRDAPDIERAVTTFALEANGGLIVTGSPSALRNRQLIITLAAQNRLPTVYLYRVFVTTGGLMSYGPDIIDEHRRAASYVDRVLKGDKPADLPVQTPTKYELVINLKTANALGLDVPQTLLATADEVIE